MLIHDSIIIGAKVSDLVCYCTEDLPGEVRSRAENADKADSKCVTSAGLFVLLLGGWLMISGVSGAPFQMTVCVPPRHQQAIRKALEMTVPLPPTCRWKVETWIEVDGFNGNCFRCSLDVSPASLRKSCKCTCGTKCCRPPPVLGKELWDVSGGTGQLSDSDTCETHSPGHSHECSHVFEAEISSVVHTSVRECHPF